MFAYDLVEYPDHWHPQTYPDRLATLATLFGMQPAPPEHCRVLELGCASGLNLIAMAHDLPESTFVGVDRAARPLERGRELAAQLGLQNISLHAQDLTDVDASFGTFDYIVAHGVYSWVPAPVRDRLLAVCKAHLAPQGVAYVSYNTYPGKYLSRMTREMMLHYARRFEDPKEQARNARAFLNFLRDAQQEDSFERYVLQHAVERIGKLEDNYLYHDDLSEVNEPFYFHEFVGHAAAHGLQYLGEANFNEMSDMNLPDKVAEVCSRLARDHNEWEQFLDFVVLRQFRQTLLCHDDVVLSRAPDPERMRAFFVGAPVSAGTSGPSGDGEVLPSFKGYDTAAVITVKDPLLHASLLYLRDRWPQFEPFDALLDAAQRQVQGRLPDRRDTADDLRSLSLSLLKLYGSRFLSLRVRRPRVAAGVSPRPVASPLARLLIRGAQTVSNLITEGVTLTDPLERLLLPLLDGTNDRAALLDHLIERVKAGDFQIEEDGTPVTDVERIRQMLGERLESALQHLAYQALLVA